MIFAKQKSKVLLNTLVNWRKTAGITQAELAKQVGVTRQSIIAIEKGTCDPSVALALRIAEYFHTSVEEIFHYE